MDMSQLVHRFALARLDLTLAKGPIVGDAHAVFQMDIQRRTPWDARSEHFVLWPGHNENLVVAQSVDRDARQLVLMVKEQRRDFWEPVPDQIFRMHLRGGRVDVVGLARRAQVTVSEVQVRNGHAFVLRRTPDRKRHLLMGRDERQLFMCRLPRPCTTVQQAHTALRAPLAVSADALRQGEWFFLPATETEVLELTDAIKALRALVHRRANIGAFIPRAGKPHVADELVVFRAEDGSRHVFVRGAVRHVDHKTVQLLRWHRVVKNLEVQEGASAFGGRWMD